MSVFEGIAAADLDRVRELASIGAGHAANALAALTGRTCEMRVPTVQLHAEGAWASAGEPPPGGGGLAGVLFEVQGGLGGVFALLFPVATCERLLERLLGGPCEIAGPAAQSALREVGNILASHAANAIGETLGVAMWPSVPFLALDDARGAIADLVSKRGRARPAFRIESEISDRARELLGIFVFVPDQVRKPGPGRAREASGAAV